MYKITLSFLLLVFIIPGAQCAPPDLLAKLKKSTRQQVIEVVDGDTVILKDQSRVRLVGIQAPRQPLNRMARKQWPEAAKAEAQKMLSSLILNQHVTLYFGGQRRDRYGRAMAHLVRDDGLWLQGEMLKNGMARVMTLPDNAALAPEMMAHETIARQAGSGIWARDYYRPKDHLMASQHKHRFQIITGIVKNVAKIKSTYYVNFGDNWRKDFTIVIKSRAARKFVKTGRDPKTFKGKKIEIRGWLKSYNGPMIEATHPEQITIIQ